MGGYNISAENFPSGDVTVTKDTTYETQGELGSQNSAAIVGSGAETVTLTNGKKLNNGVITSQGGNTISLAKLKTLNVEGNSDIQSGGGLTTWGGNVAISDVGTVNIGAKDKPFDGKNTDSFQAIHANAGHIRITDIDDLNIYSASQGIMAQRTNDTADPDAPSVDVQAKNNITIHSAGNAVMAGSINNNKGVAGVSLKAAGVVSISSDTGTGLQSFDSNKDPVYEGNGPTLIDIEGDQGVTITASSNSIAVYTARAFAETSTVNITSANGDVNITGGNAVNFKPHPKATAGSIQGMTMTGTITGKNINLTSTAGTAVYLNNGSLALKGTDANSQIRITAPEGKNAISVSGDKGALVIGENGKTRAAAAGHTDVYIGGRINVGEGAALILGSNTTTYVDNQYLTDATNPFINNDKGTVTIAGKLDIGDVDTGTALNFSNDAAVSQQAADQLVTSNFLQKFEVKDGKLVAATVDKSQAAQLLAGSVITGVAIAATANNNDKITSLFTGEGLTKAQQVGNLNALANLGELGGFSHGTYTMSNTLTDAVSAHMEAMPQDKDVWASYIHNKEDVDGLSLGGINAKYDASYDGVVAGMDLYKKKNQTAGVAIAYASGDIKGGNNYAYTKNDADYYGVSLYTRTDLTNYSLLGDVTWLHSSNDISQTVGGLRNNASPDAGAFSIGVKAVKDYQAGEKGTLTPYVGVRYMRLNTESYTSSLGVHYDADSQNLFLLPVGVNYSADFHRGEWTIRPTVGAGYVWTTGDRSTDQTVSLGSGADTFSFDTADDGSFIAKAGVSAEKGDLAFGFGYEYQDGDSVETDKWMVNASLKF